MYSLQNRPEKLAILPVSKARTNKFYIYRQCTYIVYVHDAFNSYPPLISWIKSLIFDIIFSPLPLIYSCRGNIMNTTWCFPSFDFSLSTLSMERTFYIYLCSTFNMERAIDIVMIFSFICFVCKIIFCVTKLFSILYQIFITWSHTLTCWRLFILTFLSALLTCTDSDYPLLFSNSSWPNHQNTRNFVIQYVVIICVLKYVCFIVILCIMLSHLCIYQLSCASYHDIHVHVLYMYLEIIIIMTRIL